MAQRDRVLAALYRRGRHGLTQIDFDLPDVIDGGAPIKRVAARIQELRDEGHRIHGAGVRNKCRVYVIEPKPKPAAQRVLLAERDLSLWAEQPPRARNAIYGNEAA